MKCPAILKKYRLIIGILSAAIYLFICGVLLISRNAAYPQPTVNLIPFSSIMEANYQYSSQGMTFWRDYGYHSIFASRFMILLFVSALMGVLLCLSSARRVEKVSVLVGVHTGVFVLLSAIRYLLLDRNVFLDDVLAGLSGSFCGCVFYLSIWRLLGRRKPLPQRRLMEWKRYAVGLLLLGCVVAAFAVLNRYTRCGLMRYASMQIPPNVIVEADIRSTKAGAYGFIIKEYDEVGRAVLCTDLAEQLKMGACEEIWHGDGKHGGNVIRSEVRSADSGGHLTVFTNGAWGWEASDAWERRESASFLMNDAEAIAVAKEALKPFLMEDEYVSFEELQRWEREGNGWHSKEYPSIDAPGYINIYFQMHTTSDQKVLWNDSISLEVCPEGVFSIDFFAFRVNDNFSIDAISAEQALQCAKRFAISEPSYMIPEEGMAYDGYNYIIDTISQGYIQRAGYIFPTYIFSGTCIDPNGMIRRWESTVDVVDRGMLPYIIPIVTIAIALSATLIAISKKKQYRNNEEPLSVTNQSVKVEEQPSESKQMSEDKIANSSTNTDTDTNTMSEVLQVEKHEENKDESH